MGNKQSLRKGKWDTRLLQDKLGRNVKFHITVVKPRRGVTKFRLKASVKGTPHAPSYKIDKRISDENEVEMYLQAWAEQNNPDTGGFTNRLTSLTAKQVADAQQAVEILPTGTTLLQAAQLQKLTEKTSVYTCAQFFKSWYESNEKNWKKKTRDGYSSTLKPFLTDHGSRLINTIEDEELPPYWLRHNHPQTQKNYYRNFRAFFNAANKKRLLVQNPMTPHDAPKVPRRGRPIILTLEQVQLLVKAAMNPKYDKLLVFVTLGLFVGLRPSEIENGLMGRSLKTAPHLKPMTWESINLDAEDERDWVDVGGRGKQSSERYVELSPNAISLLKFAKEKGLPVFPEKNSVNLWKALRKSIGLQGKDKWQDDIMRHTAVSYRYRCNPFTLRKGEGQRSQLSSIFGHSEYIQSTHYKNAGTTMADARAFWSIGALSWAPEELRLSLRPASK